MGVCGVWAGIGNGTRLCIVGDVVVGVIVCVTVIVIVIVCMSSDVSGRQLAR